MRRLPDRCLLLWTLACALAAQAGCLLVPDERDRGPRAPNVRPQVRITEGAATSDSAGVDYRVLFRWAGSDVDGVVARYQWAVDDTVAGAWHDTTVTSTRVNFSATREGPPRQTGDTYFTDWHTFYVRAIDSEFAFSRPDRRLFNARTIAPTSRITFPVTSEWEHLPLRLSGTALVRWEGEDIDSSRPDGKPVAYEVKLARVAALSAPEQRFLDSLSTGRNLLESPGAGSPSRWVRVDGGTTEVTLPNLPDSWCFVFGVRAVDEAGAIEPAINLRLNRNFIVFEVSSAVSQPDVFMSEARFGTHQFPGEGATWNLSVPPGVPLRFAWIGVASSYGSLPGKVNYALDIPDPECEMPRDPRGIGGWVGWGTWESNATPFRFSPDEAGTTHYLYVLMRDVSDNPRSTRRCVVKLNVVAFTFRKDALVVDDARFPGLPSDAVHDAFLSATILRRLRMLPQVADVGIWYGIEGEGPRILRMEDVADYRTIVWHVNLGSSVYSGIGDRLGRNVGLLSSFLEEGGQLFMFGGRIAGTELSDLHYPKDPPWQEADRNRLYYRFLYMRSEIVGSSDPAGDPCYAAKSGLVLARSNNPAFPDIPIDPAKWDPSAVVNRGKPNAEYRGGVPFWEGCMGGPDQPLVQLEGLDTLYTAGTWNRSHRSSCGPLPSTSDGAVLGARYQPTRGDTLLGRQHGRVLYMDFQPWYFQGDRLIDAGTAAVNWLLTGRD
jgi:hypothetical protein